MNKFFTLALLFASIFTTAQETEPRRFCGTNEAMEEFARENPDFPFPSDKPLSESITPQTGQVYIIPVVFHIVHNYGPENISDDQVRDAVRILNEDFRKLNADTSAIIQPFKAIAGDAEIEFRLAQKDPSGNCTNGIERYQSQLTFSADEDIKNSNVAPAWTSPKYMNVWVIHTIASGAAGYTYKPGWVNASRDGILIRYDYTGSIGTGSVSRSRALTHEVGHWLNLSHTWGNTNSPNLSTNCNSDDGISDTPNTIGWTSCNLNGTTCNTLDNVQNYMDYSYCTNMFTQGQVNEMRSALNSASGARNQLWTTTNLNATGAIGPQILCEARFSSTRDYVCQGDQVQFFDNSFNGQTTWNWSFPGGTPSSSTLQNPTVTYNTPGNYSVTLTIGNGSSTKTTTRNSFVRVFAVPGMSQPIAESFESASIDPAKWVINNPDGLYTWAVSNVGSSGNWSAKMNNFPNPQGSIDELISAPINLSGLSTVGIAFKVAYAQKTTSGTEYLRLFVSNNCGQTWAVRFGRSGSTLATAPATNAQFTPTLSQWEEHVVVNIPATYLTDNFMYKFEFESDGGNNLYIDDIHVGPTVSISELESNVGFEVFPNPLVEGSVAMITLNESNAASLRITDVSGRKVADIYNGQLNGGENKIQLPSNLSSGIYFLTLDTPEGRMVRKLVVK